MLAGTSIKDDKHPEANVWEKQVFAAANTLKVPTIAVLDHWTNYWQRFSNTETGEKLCYLPTRIAIMDELARKAMIAEGFPSQQLVITGNPYHDSIAKVRDNFTGQDKIDICTALGIDPSRPSYLYCSSNVDQVYPQGTSNFLGYTDGSVLDDIIEALAEMQNPVLVVRMHPAEARNTPKKFEQHVARAKEKGITAVLFPPHLSYSLHQTILATDVTLSTVSSALVEAAMLRKPAIGVQTGKLPGKPSYLEPFEQQRIVSCVYEKPKLLQALKQQTTPVDFKVEGKGTEKVTKLVYEMLGTQ